MELFDTHFHFDGEKTPQEYLVDIQNGLALVQEKLNIVPERIFLLCAGGSFSSSVRAQEFARSVDNAFFAAGVHPHDAGEYRMNREDFSFFSGAPRLVAVGEIGLDYFYDYSDRKVQRDVMAEFLELALQWKLPAMLHLRDQENVFNAYDDALAMLRDFSAAGGRFVIHCYAGNGKYAEKFLELGAFFGVTGLYTFKAATNIRDAISLIPTERLLIETDSPYLAPVPFRGRVNTPGLVGLVAAALGADRNMTPEAASDIFTANGKKFYGIN